ncbi:histidine phosphatase family protein [Macrococcus animalis]|uniref:histidine phosphatase family protein n=1 Tax=Macrococcus animalis TaxID=3395467 RepID=UPI0039BE6CEE
MLYLLRHAKANGQYLESELTSEGIEKARLIVTDLEKLDINKVYSSPMKRAIDTVTPFANKNELPINIVEPLAERILSDIEIEDWLSKLKLTFTSFDIKFNNGETSREAQERAINFIALLNPKENNLIVSHGNLIALMIMYYDETFCFKDWQSMKNPDLYTVDENGQVNHINLSV